MSPPRAVILSAYCAEFRQALSAACWGRGPPFRTDPCCRRAPRRRRRAARRRVGLSNVATIMWPGLAVFSSGKAADLVGEVDELPRLFELRSVDEIHPHQIRNVAGRDRLRELGHHFRMRNIGQIDMAVREFGVPHLDQLVDHVLVAAAALPHDQVRRSRRRGRSQEAQRSQAKMSASFSRLSISVIDSSLVRRFSYRGVQPFVGGAIGKAFPKFLAHAPRGPGREQPERRRESLATELGRALSSPRAPAGDGARADFRAPRRDVKSKVETVSQPLPRKLRFMKPAARCSQPTAMPESTSPPKAVEGKPVSTWFGMRPVQCSSSIGPFGQARPGPVRAPPGERAHPLPVPGRSVARSRSSIEGKLCRSFERQVPVRVDQRVVGIGDEHHPAAGEQRLADRRREPRREQRSPRHPALAARFGQPMRRARSEAAVVHREQRRRRARASGGTTQNSSVLRESSAPVRAARLEFERHDGDRDPSAARDQRVRSSARRPSAASPLCRAESPREPRALGRRRPRRQAAPETSNVSPARSAVRGARAMTSHGRLQVRPAARRKRAGGCGRP